MGEAEKKRDATLTTLETQKSDLQREIDTLQNFERQYRTRLKSYLTDQLRDLENSGSLAPETLSGDVTGDIAPHRTEVPAPVGRGLRPFMPGRRTMMRPPVVHPA